MCILCPGGDTLLGLDDVGASSAAAIDPWSAFTKPSTEPSILGAASPSTANKNTAHVSDSRQQPNANDPHGLGEIFGTSSAAPSSAASSHLVRKVIKLSQFN